MKANSAIPRCVLVLTVIVFSCLIRCPLAQAQPIITNQPVAQVVNIGDAVALNAGVSGTDVGYQWLKDSVILTGQTNSSIGFSSFQFTNCGNYQVVATNGSGMTISLPVALSVPGSLL